MKRISGGFTLVELTVVMVIIATLTAAIWGNFTSGISKGRDSRRKEDLETISKGFELYYNDNRKYPPGVLPTPGNPLSHPGNSAVIYLQKFPQDPQFPKAQYCYQTDSNGSYFKLYANMENRNDPKLLPTPGICSSNSYNYGISSQNTVP